MRRAPLPYGASKRFGPPRLSRRVRSARWVDNFLPEFDAPVASPIVLYVPVPGKRSGVGSARTIHSNTLVVGFRSVNATVPFHRQLEEVRPWLDDHRNDYQSKGG
jgi:hypothetical protein